MTEIHAGKNVDGMDLPDCLGRAGEDHRVSLDMSAPQAGISPSEIGISCTFHPTYSKAVAALLRQQRSADGAAFAAVLAAFSPEEQMYLKTAMDQ